MGKELPRSLHVKSRPPGGNPTFPKKSDFGHFRAALNPAEVTRGELADLRRYTFRSYCPITTYDCNRGLPAGLPNTLPVGRLAALAVLASPSAACAAGDGLHVPGWSAIPFVLLLLAVALLPLAAARWWHANRSKALVVAAIAVPTAGYLLSLGEAGRAALLHELG